MKYCKDCKKYCPPYYLWEHEYSEYCTKKLKNSFDNRLGYKVEGKYVSNFDSNNNNDCEYFIQYEEFDFKIFWNSLKNIFKVNKGEVK